MKKLQYLLLVLALALTVIPLTSGVAAAQAVGDIRVGDSEDPVAAALDISQQTFTSPVPAVVIGRSDLFPDNLGGSALAGQIGGSLLLTPPTSLDPAVSAELARLLTPSLEGPVQVYLLGGVNAISAEVEQTISDQGYNVKRLAGSGRTQTSITIAREMYANNGGSLHGIYIARDNDFADSASGGALAAMNGRAVLVNPQAALQPDVRDFLVFLQESEASKGRRILHNTRIDILGGIAAISADVELELETLLEFDVPRLAGPSRDATAVDIAQEFVATADVPVNTVTIVNGYNDTGWIYALTGGAAAPITNSPIVYASDDGISDVTAGLLAEVAPTSLVACGPASYVPDFVLEQAREATGVPAAGGAEPDPIESVPSDNGCLGEEAVLFVDDFSDDIDAGTGNTMNVSSAANWVLDSGTIDLRGSEMEAGELTGTPRVDLVGTDFDFPSTFMRARTAVEVDPGSYEMVLRMEGWDTTGDVLVDNGPDTVRFGVVDGAQATAVMSRTAPYGDYPVSIEVDEPTTLTMFIAVDDVNDEHGPVLDSISLCVAGEGTDEPVEEQSCGDEPGRSTLEPGESLVAKTSDTAPAVDGENALFAGNQCFASIMQNDGNFVIYDVSSGPLGAAPTWATDTKHSPARSITMEANGNLRLKAANGDVIWATGTCVANSTLTLQGDGNLVITAPDGSQVWESGLNTAPGEGGASSDLTPCA